MNPVVFALVDAVLGAYARRALDDEDLEDGPYLAAIYGVVIRRGWWRSMWAGQCAVPSTPDPPGRTESM